MSDELEAIAAYLDSIDSPREIDGRVFTTLDRVKRKVAGLCVHMDRAYQDGLKRGTHGPTVLEATAQRVEGETLPQFSKPVDMLDRINESGKP